MELPCLRTTATQRVSTLRVNQLSARQVKKPAFGAMKFKQTEGQEGAVKPYSLAPINRLPQASLHF